MSPQTTDDRSIMFAGRTSVSPSVSLLVPPLTLISRATIYLYLVEGFQ